MGNDRDVLVQIAPQTALRIGSWGALAVGGLLFLTGFFGRGEGIGHVAAACFLGILSRVLQAEYHHWDAAKDR